MFCDIWHTLSSGLEEFPRLIVRTNVPVHQIQGWTADTLIEKLLNAEMYAGKTLAKDGDC